jgi:hypothetical protein
VVDHPPREENRSGIRDSADVQGSAKIGKSEIVDPCTQWYVVELGDFAFYLNWKLGAVWSVFAVLGFVVIEKMLIGRVDPAGPR